MAQDLYSTVTLRILTQLEKGTAPWVQPWRSIGHSGPDGVLPFNAATGHRYRGINVVLLWIEQERCGYKTPRWITFKQAKEAGGHVRKGEKSTVVTFWKKLRVQDRVNPEKLKDILMLRSFNVFNIDQCEGLPGKITGAEPVAAPVAKFDALTEAEAFVEATGADVREAGDRACFIPSLDIIQMPPRAAFKTGDAFYATLFHELGHWTGAKSRLDRDFSGRFGSVSYAAEELVAELTSAFVCAEFGLDGGSLQHASYIAGWISLLKSDSKAFFTAASKAQAAADYLRGLAVAEDESDDDEASEAAGEIREAA